MLLLHKPNWHEYNKSSERHEQNYDNDEINSTKKKYFCENCDKEFFLSIKDIFLHKKSHRKT